MGVGIIGAGQLARMLAMAAKRMGISLVVQGPCGDDPAVGVASGWVQGPLGAPEAVKALAEQVDVIGFENELVDLAPLQALEQAGVVFRPSLDTLASLTDKRRQRRVLQDLNIPVPAWMDLKEALACPERLDDLGYPLMAKAASGGYDGRGLRTIDNTEALKAFVESVCPEDWYLERFVDFERELAMVGARSAGNPSGWPGVRHGACPGSRAPERGGPGHHHHRLPPAATGLRGRAGGGTVLGAGRPPGE